MVIDGFFIEMSAKEIVAHLRARAKAHDDAADVTARRIRDRLDGESARARRGPEDDPEIDDVQTERDRAHELRFLAEHVPADATFRLDPNDLAFLELVDRGTYRARRPRWR